MRTSGFALSSGKKRTDCVHLIMDTVLSQDDGSGFPVVRTTFSG
jgi:hypothetical protein